ncbi:methylated-DNA--[protein]-cysteine S-methyltransferase [Alloalcanivorax xenomutans]|uniref:methylated-DNA--[protein]-cysteine S-methyltransferase n=1 Tax=Alloalcanivorax xenomutans TaxID=1094342 RepID=UPI0024E22AB2|nr:methylated-DNA--[protein]-cysteine S-methyltransferase [Alloalcanivorax xenomutans]
MTYRADVLTTPLGPMIALVDQQGALVRLEFVDGQHHPASVHWRGLSYVRDAATVRPVAEQLDAYFAEQLTDFDVPLAPLGNAFLQEAWRHLRRVPYGTTISYGELATRLPRPTSARAIGRANAVNPIAIIVPCYRVIGADGSLTGYAGGIERKQALLELERALPQRSLL